MNMGGWEMKVKGWYILLLLIIVTTFVLTGVANNVFPQGESYPTGIYIEQDWGPGGEEWNRMPSPSSNPTWVRFLQNNAVIVIWVGMAGLIFTMYKLSNGFGGL